MAILSLTFPVLLTALCAVAPAHAVYPVLWTGGFTSSYYGGQGDGGSCGYGTAAESGYGVNTASASVAIYGNGALCGACFKVQCVNSRICTRSVSPMVTVSNLCPQQSSGGWCDSPRKSLSLAPAVWNVIATNPNVGNVPVRVKRVPCVHSGGIIFSPKVANPSYIAVLIKNVGGSGDLRRVTIQLGGGSYLPMQRSYGSVWQYVGNAITSRSLSFQLTTGLSQQTVTVRNILPPNPIVNFMYRSQVQFPTPRRSAMEVFNATAYLVR